MKPRKSPSSRSKHTISKQVKAPKGPKGSKPAKKQLEDLKTANYRKQAAKEEVESHNSERFGNLLSTEIWILIFELLYSISDRASYSKLRFISRKFDEIVTPIIFRRFELLPGLTVARPNAMRSGILSKIRSHTRHFVLNQYSKQRGVTKFLLQCRSLRDIHCKIDDRGSPLPIDIYNAVTHDLPHIKLHLDCSRHSPSGGPHQIFEEISSVVNCQSLVSLTTPKWCISDSDSLHCAALVVASKNLKILEVLDCKPFETGDQELPAIQKLTIALDLRLHQDPSLRNVPMAKIWNFSNLTHLKIRNGWSGNLQRLRSFLSIVSDEQPSGIESLILLSSQPWNNRHSGYFIDDGNSPAKVIELLHKIIGTINHLREFKLAWNFPQRLSFILPKHQDTLRSLGLWVGAQGGPPVSSAEIRQIRTSCPYLTQLIIDIRINRHLGEPEMEFQKDSKHGIGVVKELSQFQHLRRLKTYISKSHGTTPHASTPEKSSRRNGNKPTES